MRTLIAVSLCALAIGCSRVSERELVGTWRSEKDGAVDELALQADHTLVHWLCPAELTTPQTFVWRGEWHLKRNQIDIEAKRLDVDATQVSPSSLSEHSTLNILGATHDALTLKTAEQSTPITAHRIAVAVCAGATVAPAESQIVGTWRVHFHTHDFKYQFTPDHRVAVSARDLGDFLAMWKGSWNLSGDRLVMDLQGNESGVRPQRPDWTLYGYQGDCFAIKDPYGISYVVHRVSDSADASNQALEATADRR